MAKQETLGELIKRRMKELGIASVAQLARMMGKSRSYVNLLANDTNAKKDGGIHVPDPEMIEQLATALSVPKSEVVSAVYALPLPSAPKKPALDVREVGFAFFGGGRELSEEDWEEIIAVTQTLISEKEKRLENKKE